MIISLLSGAYKNAGDFLIVKRCKELLKDVYPNCEIIEYQRRFPLNKHLDQINSSSCLLFAGGPAYISNLYPTNIPLIDDLNKIKVPFFAMALGSHFFGSSHQVYKYKFSPPTISLLKRIERDGYALGCRDWVSQRLLRSNGIKNSKMTGCAAWYNLPYVNSANLKSYTKYKKICISDPAQLSNLQNSFNLAKYLKITFPYASINFVFHRGTNKDEFTTLKEGEQLKKLKESLNKAGICTQDIAFSSDGFNVYNDCDLHIGFRVHAHIYNLSCRRASILIEEDSRGFGVNEALGIRSISAKKNQNTISNRYLRKTASVIKFHENSFLIREVDDYLQYLSDTSHQQYQWAFERMNYYYGNMKSHILSIERRGDIA